MLEPGPSVQSGADDGKQPPSPSSSYVIETTGHFTKIKALGKSQHKHSNEARGIPGEEEEEENWTKERKDDVFLRAKRAYSTRWSYLDGRSL